MPDANELIPLTSAGNEIEAAVILSRLDAEGIVAKQVGGLTSGFRAEAPGFVKILVQRSDYDHAVKVLKEVGNT